MRYMLMICDDESDDRGPLELVRDTEHVSWIDYLDRQWDLTAGRSPSSTEHRRHEGTVA